MTAADTTGASQGNGTPHALITGGTRGIGFGIAQAFLDAGYTVTATGVSADEVSACPARDGLDARVLDVTDGAAIAALIGSLPRLDVLVNCAGIIIREGREFEPDTFAKVIDVNLNGTMRMCAAARQKLAASGRGAIINTASMLSFFGSPFVPAYSASKGGVAQLTKSLAAAWADDGIRVNALAPGWIETELTKNLVQDEARSAGLMARTPMNRWGRPDDLGGVAVFLASDAAAYMTGVILPVDGGYLAV